MRFLLLDRDGTVIRDPGKPLMTIASADILPGVVGGLRLLRDKGYRFFLMTNQGGIGRGLYTERRFLGSQEQIAAAFREQGITFDDGEYCPHHPADGCGCRKPATGMWERLRARHPALRPAEGVMVGNRDTDVLFGRAVGCRTARVDSGQYPYSVPADDTVRDLGELATRLVGEPPRVLSTEEAARFAGSARAEGKTVVTTNGAFDLLHPGHLFLLTRARMRGDALVVGVNSDASVRRSKGPDRPVESQDVRAARLARHADAVFIFDDDDPRSWLQAIRPAVHVNAETYGRDCIEAGALREIGAELVLVPVRPDLGSTSVLLRSRSS